MVDYSKWNKFKFDDSSDEEMEDQNNSDPRVTRFETGQKITFGGKNKENILVEPSEYDNNSSNSVNKMHNRYDVEKIM